MATALITGASSGIGYELARCFARDRHDVVLVARREERLRQLSGELQRDYDIAAHILPADLTLPETPYKIWEHLTSQNIAIEFLVNNAGLGEYGPFTVTKWERELQSLQVNVVALTHLTKLFLPPMLERNSGRVLNVASTAAFQPGPLMAVYFATKAYVLSFSEAVNYENRGSGVTVTALCPGPTHSGFQESAAMHQAGLFHRRRIPDSPQVAEFGYQAMLRGRAVAIEGWINKVLATSVRFAPRPWVLEVTRLMSQPVNQSSRRANSPGESD